MTGTQARLPGTLPTPRQAREHLQAAIGAERSAAKEVEGFKLHLKSARAELKAAAGEMEAAEEDFLAAAPDSPEERAADAKAATAWARSRKAERGITNLLDTSRAARSRLAECRQKLRSAREELEAVREGRRRR